MGKKRNIIAIWTSLFAFCFISTELVDKIGAPLEAQWLGLLAPYT
jgi:hypothetical protein